MTEIIKRHCDRCGRDFEVNRIWLTNDWFDTENKRYKKYFCPYCGHENHEYPPKSFPYECFGCEHFENNNEFGICHKFNLKAPHGNWNIYEKPCPDLKGV